MVDFTIHVVFTIFDVSRVFSCLFQVGLDKVRVRKSPKGLEIGPCRVRTPAGANHRRKGKNT